MKRLITILLLTVFSVFIFTTPIYAAEWDPATGPNWPERANVERAFPSGDDSPWNDADESGGNDSNQFDYSKYFSIKFFFIWILPVSVDFEKDITTGDYAESSGGDINSSRNSAGQ
ncbi:MAG: hypothetical protein ACT6FE_05165 [Methanosarcinaceae archaeon]